MSHKYAQVLMKRHTIVNSISCPTDPRGKCIRNKETFTSNGTLNGCIYTIFEKLRNVIVQREQVDILIIIYWS